VLVAFPLCHLEPLTYFILYSRHTIIKKLNKLRESDKELAQLIAKQLFANAMVGAGLAEDPRMLLTNMNTLLSKALDKY